MALVNKPESDHLSQVHIGVVLVQVVVLQGVCFVRQCCYG